MSKFWAVLSDPKIWRTLLVNAAAIAPVAAGFVPEPYGAALIALANVVNHAFNVATQPPKP